MTCAGHLPQGCLNRDAIFLFFNELWGIPLSLQRPDMTIAEKPAAKRFANTWMCFFEPPQTEAQKYGRDFLDLSLSWQPPQKKRLGFKLEAITGFKLEHMVSLTLRTACEAIADADSGRAFVSLDA